VQPAIVTQILSVQAFLVHQRETNDLSLLNGRLCGIPDNRHNKIHHGTVLPFCGACDEGVKTGTNQAGSWAPNYSN